MTESSAQRPASWKWWICGLLLCATTINYMDRQTLANVATRITREFALTQEQYGDIEFAFGWAFAAGSLIFGFAADRVSVRLLYPAVLVCWSAAGFATGFMQSYEGLIVCRALLGLFEAGHWPCALKTTQHLLDARNRAMGNSILQSGASVGAILTPLLMRAMLTEEPGGWRFSFQAIGAIGLLWVVFWLALVRESDMPVTPGAPARAAQQAGETPFLKVVFSRRFAVLMILVCFINTTWQILRAWLPKFLMEGRGYPEAHALYFTSAYYVATDVGCLGAGVLTLWFHKRGLSVHGARSLVYFFCALLTALSTAAAFSPKGWPLLGLLLLVAVGSLGLFPCYYAFTQELSVPHMGKITGAAGVVAWATSAPMQKLFGRLIDRTGSFDTGIAIVGWLPLAAFVFLWLFWDWPWKARASVENGAHSF